MTFPLQQIHPQFFDNNGLPLDAGYVYVGTANLNPETNPISIYWDSAGTIPAAQPLRTSGGAIVRNGTVATVFTSTSAYSVTVRDQASALVTHTASADNLITAVTADYTAADVVVTNAYIAADVVVTNAYIAADASKPMRNRLYNGDFQVAQRATTYALTTTAAYGSVDRWASIMEVSAAGICNQIASTGGTRNFHVKVGRNSGSVLLSTIKIGQALESVDSRPLAGQTVVLSFVAKAGANYSSAGSILNVRLITGTGTDQSSTDMFNLAWTGSASNAYDPTITTGFVRYSTSFTLATSVTQVGVQFSYIPTGTAGADDNFYLSDVQLEIATSGSTAPSTYDRRQYGDELQRCERYYQQIALGHIITVAGAGEPVTATCGFRSIMRTTPTYSQFANNTLYTTSNCGNTATGTALSPKGVMIYRDSTGATISQWSETAAFAAEL